MGILVLKIVWGRSTLMGSFRYQNDPRPVDIDGRLGGANGVVPVNIDEQF